MTSNGDKAGASKVLLPAPLIRALDQSEQVKDKVEQCAAELSSVNAVLKEEIADGAPLRTLRPRPSTLLHSRAKSKGGKLTVRPGIGETTLS